jgi:Rrf2 family protein
MFQLKKGRNDLRITHEADYAIRVVYCLALAGGKQCAKDISETTGVTLRFALKILRKLTQSGITKSYKGVAGGYELNRSPSEISLGEIIECIDGPIAINHCLANEFQCTRVNNRSECDFHRVFGEINRSLRDQLMAIKMERFLPGVKK